MQSRSLKHPIQAAAEAASLVLAVSWPDISRAATWQLTLLSGLEEAHAINNQGLVVGQTLQQATFWHDGLAISLAEVSADAIRPLAACVVSPLGLMAGDGGNLRGANWTDGVITQLDVLRQRVSTRAIPGLGSQLRQRQQPAW